MNTAAIPASETPRHEFGRNVLVRLLGWRGVLFQSDPPTWDRWRWVTKYFRGSEAVRTLDAGSGAGGFTMYAAAQGNQVVGLSFDDAAIGIASRRAQLLGLGSAQFRPADLRALDRLVQDLGQFDQILCLETIEHVVADGKLVADLARLLRPGGTLLLTTPNLRHRPLVGEVLSSSEDGGHVRWGYTFERLRELFARAGLEVVAEDYVTGLISQQITNLARILARRLGERAAWVLTAPLRVFQVLDRPLSRIVGYPWLSVAVVGVKP